MYKVTENQLSVYDFVSPFSGKLSENNRWVRLSKQIDWYALEQKYAAHFGAGGKRALGARCAFGSLVIKQALGLSDVQTVLLIEENPYLQYFIGLPAFSPAAPFSARTMARFRQRISPREVADAARLLRAAQGGQHDENAARG